MRISFLSTEFEIVRKYEKKVVDSKNAAKFIDFIYFHSLQMIKEIVKKQKKAADYNFAQGTGTRPRSKDRIRFEKRKNQQIYYFLASALRVREGRVKFNMRTENQ